MKTLYKELNPKEFRKKIEIAPIAYLPLGTLEWHGEHMPLGADAIQPEGLFECIAKNVGGVVYPTLFLGPDRKDVIDGEIYYGMDALGQKQDNKKMKYELQALTGSCYWVEKDVFEKILRSILLQMQRIGIKILVAHGHGPSTSFFISKFEEFYNDFGIRCIHCWDFVDNKNVDMMYEDFQTGHGGVNETSTVMALRPDLVNMDNLGNIEFPVGVFDDPRSISSEEIGNKILNIKEKRVINKIKTALKKINKGDI